MLTAIPDRIECDSFEQVKIKAQELMGTKRVVASRLWRDYFSGPKNWVAKVLGISMQAVRFCEKTEPNGKWIIDVNERRDGFIQMQAWYSRYTPYAVAMMNSERGHEMFGCDYNTLNVTAGTVMGFCDLGLGNYNVICESDVRLYSRIYNIMMRLKSPSLPFDEAWWPACAFVAVQKPKLWIKSELSKCWIQELVSKCMTELTATCTE